MIKLKKFIHAHKLLVVSLIIVVCIGLLITVFLHKYSSAGSKVERAFMAENAKLHNPIDAFGIQNTQLNNPYCRREIAAVRKNDPTLYKQVCTYTLNGTVYLSGDSVKQKVKKAAKQLNDDLKANGWQPEDGHADISFWANFIIDHDELLKEKGETHFTAFGNTLHKQLDVNTKCLFATSSIIQSSGPTGISLSFSCDYELNE